MVDAVSTDQGLDPDSTISVDAALTDDALRCVFERLSMHDRLNVSQVCQRWRRLNSVWHDIDNVHLGLFSIGVSNSYGVESVLHKPCNLQHALQQGKATGFMRFIVSKLICARNLSVHDASLLRTLPMDVLDRFTQLEQLTLPNEAFYFQDRGLEAPLSILLANKHITSLRVLSSALACPLTTRIFTPAHVKMIGSSSISILQLQGVVLGPTALEALADRFSDSIVKLRLGAVCVNTADSPRYWTALKNFRQVRVLEIPPSLLTLTDTVCTDPLRTVIGKFSKLEEITMLAARVSAAIVRQALAMLPPSVTRVNLRDVTGELCFFDAPLVESGIDLVFLPGKYAHYRVPRGFISDLFVQKLWLPPYFPHLEMTGFGVTGMMLLAQQSSWQLTVPNLTFMEDASTVEMPVHTAERTASTTSVATAEEPTLEPIVEESSTEPPPATPAEAAGNARVATILEMIWNQILSHPVDDSSVRSNPSENGLNELTSNAPNGSQNSEQTTTSNRGRSVVSVREAIIVAPVPQQSELAPVPGPVPALVNHIQVPRIRESSYDNHTQESDTQRTASSSASSTSVASSSSSSASH